MQFKQVIGQQNTKKLLIKSVQENRIGHAQLFLGAEGAGNLALALAYAQYINCLDPQADDSCGQCRSCTKSQKRIHPDLHYCYPTIGGKAKSTDFVKQWRMAIKDNVYMSVYQWLQKLQAENKQGNITAQECEDIVKKLSMTIFEGRYKILIIWMPEYLGKEGNRLLKLIEEPPENTVFLLVAQNPDLILNTILSRTQILKVKRLSDYEISDFLQKEKGIEAAQANAVGALAEGNYNAALSYLESNNTDNQRLMTLWFSHCLTKNIWAASQWTEEVAKIGREAQKNLIKYALLFLRQTLRLQLLPDLPSSLRSNEKQIALQLLEKMGLEQFEQLIALFDKTVFYVERNAHPKVLFFNLSIATIDILSAKQVQRI